MKNYQNEDEDANKIQMQSKSKKKKAWCFDESRVSERKESQHYRTQKGKLPFKSGINCGIIRTATKARTRENLDLIIRISYAIGAKLH